MLALERRNLILEKLQEEKRVVVSELSHLFGVSEETIRRDLEKLEQDGYATKSYGGAVLNENVGFDMPLHIRSRKNVAAKQKIGAIAASLVRDGDHIMLDASSTDLFIAKALKSRQRLTIVTNSIEIILELSEMQGWTVISTGGTLKEGYLALLGPEAEASTESYYADKTFISCKGIDLEAGAMDSVQAFTAIKRKEIRHAKEKYLVADHTKFGKTAFCKICDLRDFDAIITDEKPSDEWLEAMRQYKVACLYPGMPEEDSQQA